MAVDFGLRRIGIAVSDEGGSLARPAGTVRVPRNGDPLPEILRLVGELAPDRIVVGEPRRLDGSPGSLAEAVAILAGRLRELSGLPVVLWDERLTTLEAEEKLRETGAGRKKRRARIDEAAAAVILQDYLDSGRARG